MQGRKPTHGDTGTSLHKAWLGMKGRCKHSHGYVSKGLTVSQEWASYPDFKKDMGDSFAEGLTLDRIDNGKGYSKENCRWATRKVQQNNRDNNSRVFYEKKEYTIAELAVVAGINYRAFLRRVVNYGWTVKKAVETPLLSKRQIGILSSLSPKHVNNN